MCSLGLSLPRRRGTSPVDSIALILVLIPIGILSLIVFFLGRKIDYFISRSEFVESRRMAQSRNTLESFLMVQRHWSARTFGLGAGRWKGIVAHVEKELREIEQDPLDLDEWIDVIILGFDGAWRTGASNHAIISALFAKQAKNRRREWVVSEDESVPAEHVKPRQRLSDVLYQSDPQAKQSFKDWTEKAEKVIDTMSNIQPPVAPTSIDISVYPHKVTGKWAVQVGNDISCLAQFESEDAAKHHALQVKEAMAMQMKHLEESILKVSGVPSPEISTAPDGAKKTNLRRLSPEEQQRIMADPKAYEEWRGACGLERPGTLGEVP